MFHVLADLSKDGGQPSSSSTAAAPPAKNAAVSKAPFRNLFGTFQTV